MVAGGVILVVLLNVAANVLVHRDSTSDSGSLHTAAKVATLVARVSIGLLIAGLLIALGRVVKRNRELEDSSEER